MNEPSKINPYESPDMFSGAERQRVDLTIQQKADAIKSTKRRLKENESKVEIFNDYKNTNIEKTIRNILLSTPTLQRRKKNTWANLLLLLSFVVFCLLAMSFRLAVSQINLGLLILSALQMFTAYQIANFYRPGYWTANVWVIFFLLWRFPSHLKSAEESGIDALLITTAMIGILAAGLAFFLLFRLFPDNRPFVGHRRTPDGDPIFDN